MFRLVVTYVNPHRQQNYNFDSLGAAMNRASVEKVKQQFHRMELYVIVETWERQKTREGIDHGSYVQPFRS